MLAKRNFDRTNKEGGAKAWNNANWSNQTEVQLREIVMRVDRSTVLPIKSSKSSKKFQKAQSPDIYTVTYYPKTK